MIECADDPRLEYDNYSMMSTIRYAGALLSLVSTSIFILSFAMFALTRQDMSSTKLSFKRVDDNYGDFIDGDGDYNDNMMKANHQPQSSMLLSSMV